MYTLPTIAEFRYGKDGVQSYINKWWLDKLKLPVPVTTQDFFNTMKAFKDNNIGGPNTVCLTGWFGGYQPMGTGGLEFTTLFGAFGVVDNPRHIMIKNGRIVFSPIETGYRKALEWYHSMYANGLIDPEVFTQTQAVGNAKTTTDEGVGTFINNLIPGWNNANVNFRDRERYIHLLPLKGPDGNQMWQDVSEPVGLQANRFWITKTCKYPEAAMRWIDFLCDDGEMSLNSRNGPKGVRWDWNNKGQWYTIATAPNETPEVTLWARNYCVTNLVPWVWTDRMAKLRDVSNDWITDFAFKVHDRIQPFQDKNPVPTFLKYDPKDSKELATLQADLHNLVMENMPRFIKNGVTDAAWNNYTREVERYNVKRYLEIIQKAYDIYMK